MASVHAKLRKNINGKTLITMLNNHMLDPELYPLKQTQVNVANMLLKRCLPELRSIEHQGRLDSKIDITLTVEKAEGTKELDNYINHKEGGSED